MSYGDITWCKASECTHFSTCIRALNDTVIEKAKRWWGGDDFPVSYYSNPKELDCYETNPPAESKQEEAGTG